MKRLSAAVKLDILIQWRNRLYLIGIGVGLLSAGMMAWLTPVSLMSRIVPCVMLLVIGGSTIMYIGGMVVFERDERTLAATIVSPLRSVEYLWSKLATLGLLSTFESLVIVVGCLWIQSLFEQVPVPNFLPILVGIVLLGLMYTLAGFILIVRFRSITEFLIPMAVVATIAQLPIFYFLEMISNPVLLIIPSSAPAMLIRGGYTDLSGMQWGYAICYSLFVVGVMVGWAHRAFLLHVVRKAG